MLDSWWKPSVAFIFLAPPWFLCTVLVMLVARYLRGSRCGFVSPWSSLLFPNNDWADGNNIFRSYKGSIRLFAVVPPWGLHCCLLHQCLYLLQLFVVAQRINPHQWSPDLTSRATVLLTFGCFSEMPHRPSNKHKRVLIPLRTDCWSGDLLNLWCSAIIRSKPVQYLVCVLSKPFMRSSSATALKPAFLTLSWND